MRASILYSALLAGTAIQAVPLRKRNDAIAMPGEAPNYAGACTSIQNPYGDDPANAYYQTDCAPEPTQPAPPPTVTVMATVTEPATPVTITPDASTVTSTHSQSYAVYSTLTPSATVDPSCTAYKTAEASASAINEKAAQAGDSDDAYVWKGLHSLAKVTDDGEPEATSMRRRFMEIAEALFKTTGTFIPQRIFGQDDYQTPSPDKPVENWNTAMESDEYSLKIQADETSYYSEITLWPDATGGEGCGADGPVKVNVTIAKDKVQSDKEQLWLTVLEHSLEHPLVQARLKQNGFETWDETTQNSEQHAITWGMLKGLKPAIRRYNPDNERVRFCKDLENADSIPVIVRTKESPSDPGDAGQSNEIKAKQTYIVSTIKTPGDKPCDMIGEDEWEDVQIILGVRADQSAPEEKGWAAIWSLDRAIKDIDYLVRDVPNNSVDGHRVCGWNGLSAGEDQCMA